MGRLISVITISYNARECIERAILSTIGQDYDNFEYIIIDGDSNDGTKQIIETYKDKISIYVSEPDTGIYNAMNKGIDLATGEYCIFMNAGDTFITDHVLTDFSQCIGTRKDIYNGNAVYLKNGKIMWYRKCHKDISCAHFFKSSICHQATFIKTSLLKKLHYDESYRMVSDWKFWLLTLCQGTASYETIDMDVCVFDMGGLTNTQAEKGQIERQRALKEVFSEDEISKYKLEVEKRKRNRLRNYSISIQRHFWLYYARMIKKRVWKL